MCICMCMYEYILVYIYTRVGVHTVATQGHSKPGVRCSGEDISGIRPHQRQRATQLQLMSRNEDGSTIKDGPPLLKGGGND